MKNQKEILLLIVILIAGTILRLYRLDYQSFWNDEIITINILSSSLVQIITDYDITNLPLYFLLVCPLLMFENHELWVRLPSVFFGSLSIFLIFITLRNWLGKSIAFLGSALMAISPFHVFYSQEARPYSLLVFLSLLSFWFLQESLKRQENKWLKLGFVISIVTVLYCHAVGIAFFGFLITYILISVPRRKWKEWLLVFGIIILLTLPGAFQILPLSSQPSADLHRSFNLLFVPYTIWTFITGYSLGPTVVELHMPDRFNYVIANIHIILPIMLFCCSLFCFGTIKLWKQDKLIFLFVALWFLFPLGNAILGSIITVQPFNIRYAILAFAPFLIFCAIGIWDLKFTCMPIVALSIAGLISVLSLYNYYFDGRYQRDNNRAAAEFLMTHAKPNDLVIGSASYTLTNLKYYYHGKHDLIFKGYPVDGKNAKYARLESDLSKIITNRNHFWLFLSRTFHSDPQEYIRKFVDEYFIRNIEFTSNGVELIRYKRKS